jgi:hypothetical protein
VPTLVDIAGGPKGDGLKKQIEAGKYPGIVNTTLDAVDQRDYLEGKKRLCVTTSSTTAVRIPSAVRYNNWKFYYAMVPTTRHSKTLSATHLRPGEIVSADKQLYTMYSRAADKLQFRAWILR